MPGQRDRTSQPVYSVTEVTRAIKGTLEGKFSSVWIEGEISNHRCPASGHHYFTLKDANAQLACVLFRGQAQFNRTELADGLQVQVSGDISVYENRGQYQLIAQWVQPKGLGALQAKFEALKAKLNAERLFDSGTKIAIPRFPRTIAVVTSPTGAAVQDILNVIRRRAPWVRVLVMPVAVQGQGSERDIEAAIRWLSKRPESIPHIDTLIVARGGGSLEDLWSFNDEGVARAIYDCPIPVISGVGHEIDFTIADFVADRREPTPSAAAEFAVPDGAALIRHLEMLNGTLEHRLESELNRLEQSLDHSSQMIGGGDFARFFDSKEADARHLIDRFSGAIVEQLAESRSQLDYFANRVEAMSPEKEIDFLGRDLERVFSELESMPEKILERWTSQLSNQKALIEALNPQTILSRGYSMTMNAAGEPITKVKSAKSGDKIRTLLSDGEVSSVVE